MRSEARTWIAPFQMPVILSEAEACPELAEGDLLSFVPPRRSGRKQVLRLRTSCFAQDDEWIG
jgi:hypothetical protein